MCQDEPNDVFRLFFYHFYFRVKCFIFASTESHNWRSLNVPLRMVRYTNFRSQQYLVRWLIAISFLQRKKNELFLPMTYR